MSDRTVRINRFLSQAGLGSRRAVEALVREGRVSIDGAVVTDLSTRVRADQHVEVDGRSVRARPPGRILLLHKPVGVVCSFARQDERPCLRDLLGPDLLAGRLFHVGRLDHDSSGLLLLTDDGELCERLTHPRHPVFKHYEVVTEPRLDDGALERLANGSLVLDGRACAPAEVERDPDDAARLRLALREGRNRQIRRMVELVGARVTRLHRFAIGPVQLGRLGVGEARAATPEEITALRRACGLDPPTGD